MNNSQHQGLLTNTLKSFTVLALGSLAFVLLITLFPFMGSLTMKDFPIQQIIIDNSKLLIPLISVSIIISPFLGWACFKFTKKRILKLLAIAILGNWLAILLVMLIWSGFTVYMNDIDSFLFLSVWAVITYSLYSIPILLPSIFIIEKWTRIK